MSIDEHHFYSVNVLEKKSYFVSTHFKITTLKFKVQSNMQAFLDDIMLSDL